MTKTNVEEPLDALINLELSSVEFIRDYVQLRFDGTTLTAIMPIKVISNDVVYEWGESGYRDSLCEPISSKISKAEVIEGEALSLWFEDGTHFTISLEPELYRTEEAVILNIDKENWWIW